MKDTVKKPSESPKKARISIAIDRGFLIWIDEMIKKGIFANRSHSIHRALVNDHHDNMGFCPMYTCYAA